MPLPSTRVIPGGWNAHHRPTATASLNGRCRIVRPDTDRSDDPYDETTLQYTPGPGATVYTGPCRIQAMSAADSRLLFGEQDVTTSTFRVVVEWDADVALNDVVEVLEAQDPDLPGVQLRILNWGKSTEQWERDLICQEHQG